MMLSKALCGDIVVVLPGAMTKQDKHAMKRLDPKRDGRSSDLLEEKLGRLRELFPEVFSEGKIDFEILRETLGDAVDDSSERYRFTWHGKGRARNIAHMPSSGTLRPCPESSIGWEQTKNLFIEGDNLEVLKLLQKSYHCKVKLIYIDPPYNTGKEFIYSDKYQDSLGSYLRYTGQVDAEGFKLSSNPESSGRYHTNWLNMMYPRLKLARNLLREDGVMCISIDEHELANLLKLLEEIFGEENLIATISNVNNPKGRSDGAFIATAHEYMVVVARDRERTKFHGFEPDEGIVRRYNRVDDRGRKYRHIDLRKTGDSDRRADRPAMFYYFFYNVETKALRVDEDCRTREGELAIAPLKESGEDGRWRWGMETAKAGLDNLEARFMPNRKMWGVFEKDYLDDRDAVKPTSAWTWKDVNSERGTESFLALGFPKGAFPRPKPVGTMERVLRMCTLPEEESLVLDFFAGSCSLVEAIHGLVARGARRLRYLMVQLPVGLDANKPADQIAHQFCLQHGIEATIAGIGRERIRRSAARIAKSTDEAKVDLGFRVFKLDTSNIQAWDVDFHNVENAVSGAVDVVKPGRSEADLLYEASLKYGLDLSVPVERRVVEGKKVYIVDGGALVACFDRDIEIDVAEGIALLKAELQPELMRVVFRDSGFVSDEVKVNTVQLLRQANIDDVVSL